MENFWLFLLNVNVFFQHLGETLFTPMRFLSFLGDEEFYLVVMPAIYWCYDSRIGLKVGLLLMLSNGVNAFFKFLFHAPRPFWVSNSITPMVTENSFGVPSGHAQNAFSVWGFFSTIAKRTWIRVFFVVLIILIGISRLYLGVHFILDVLVGWLIGGLLLWLFNQRFERIQSTILHWSKSKQWFGTVGISFLMILLPGLVRLLNINWEIKPDYLLNIQSHLPDFELNPFSMDGVISAAAVVFGIFAGLILVHDIIPLGKIKADILHLFFRFIIGTAGALIIWMGLKLVFPDDIAIVSEILRFIRYGLLGFWVSAGAPYVFLKTGLQEKKKSKNNRRR